MSGNKRLEFIIVIKLLILIYVTLCFCLQAPTSQNSAEPPVKKAKVEGKLLMQPDSRYACDNYDIIYITLLVGNAMKQRNDSKCNTCIKSENMTWKCVQ